MKHKTLITAALLVFVLASVAFFIAKESRQGSETFTPGAGQTIAMTPEIDPEKTSPQPSHKVIVYYFHGMARCPSCRKIEAYTYEGIQDSFAKALKDDRLEWHAVNVEEDSNKHFVKDFKLYTKSVVVVSTRNGKQICWKNLEKVWELLHDKNAFLQYIRDEIRSYLARD